MRQANLKEVIIFSVYNKCYTPETNREHHNVVRGTFEWYDSQHKELIGCYKGDTEKSFVVSVEQLRQVKLVTRIYGQESYLILDNERGAWSVDVKSKEKVYLGRFLPVSKQRARQEEGWTFDPINKQYYIISDICLGKHFNK